MKKGLFILLMLLCVCCIRQPVQAKVIYSMNDLPETKSIVTSRTLKAPEVTAPCGTKLRNIVFPANQNWYWIIDYNSLDKKVSIDNKTYIKAVYIKNGASTGKIATVRVKVFEDLRYHHYKKPTSEKAGNYTYYNCRGCGKYYNKNKKQIAANSYIIPVIPSSKEVIMGKTIDASQLITDGSKAFSKVSVNEKYKKYLTISGRKLKLCKEFKKGLPSEIPVTIEMKDAERTSGKKYYTVKIKITPDIKITRSLVNGGTKYRYNFEYNFVGATKVKVRVKEYDAPSMNRVMDNYVSGIVNTDRSYMLITTGGVNSVGGALTFVITVYYDNTTITRTIRI